MKKEKGILPLFFLLWITTSFSAVQAPVPPNIAPPPTAGAETKKADDKPPPVAIPIADIAVQSESALLNIRQLESEAAAIRADETSEEDLEALSRAVAIRSVEMRRLLIQNSSIDAIRDLERSWKELEERIGAITRDLTQIALDLDTDLATLEKIEERWVASKATAEAENAPAAILNRIGDITSAAVKAKKRMLQRRADILALQAKAASLEARASQARETLRAGSERATARLMHRDSPPLWSKTFWAGWIGEVSTGEDADLPTHASVLKSYMQYQQRSVAMHILLFTGSLMLLYFVRRKIQGQRESDSSFKDATAILDAPLITALLLALLASTWVYPRAPRILWIIIGMFGVVPVVLLARRMMAYYLYPALYALAALYFVDKVRAFIAVLPVVSRIMLLVELLLFLAAVLWTMRILKNTTSNRSTRLPGQRTVRVAGTLFGFLAVAALAANANGQVRLAGMIGAAVILSSYVAVVLFTSMRVVEGLLHAIVCVPPVSLLDMVKRKKDVLLNHFQRWLRWAAYASWIALTLQSLGLLQPLLTMLKNAWAKVINIGTFAPTVGDIITFILIIWATFSLSRLTRFVLEEEAYPKLQLERGLPYAISTVVHYMVLLTGFVLALNALKVDMTKFTILAGALSVGIGFGLQNIVNNFVSGLIVLFERPVKVGDTIQMDDVIGRVKHIGIRASIIASTSGAEVIIPNGKLISERVTNWTLSSKLRQVMIVVTTKASYDASEIKQLLLDIAKQDARVADKPAPDVLFVKRTIDQAEFELHVWTAELDEWLSLKSDLMSEINEALRRKESSQ
ncbi:mechanosensitive ion channel [Oxalobacteraceae bacterium R-40]|uniref:Mechanosensitive ion channel n=1 Tax=Keguizhuia sedimenti TaxID=3064264 RepID=A0ABU1BKE6_9BURK|nr:mechanosensitive ion channel [Oxalobacteraceae bacterium R-40]